MSRVYDVVVFDGGPAGFWAAIVAAARGRKVVLAETGEVGGICLNRGCVPSLTAALLVAH